MTREQVKLYHQTYKHLTTLSTGGIVVASALLSATDRFVGVATFIALVSLGLISLVSIVMMFTLPGNQSAEVKSLDVSGSAIVILLLFTIAFACFVLIVFRRSDPSPKGGQSTILSLIKKLDRAYAKIPMIQS